ncbi:hypothetical protein ACBJ59_58895 [Nonomuraea sp. MTCD27]|uniref:hypothetical protein n=1 Tax=Nonomuraea sp. MTCD27 TaxID=1676747 RepID=UPI0035BFCBEE
MNRSPEGAGRALHFVGGELQAEAGGPQVPEQAQVREYATDPDGYDRQAAMARAEQQAEQAQRQAEREAEEERREAEQRCERLGDDEPGPVVWALPVFFALYADADEVEAVANWLEANGLEDVSGRHEVRVEQRATRRAAVYEAPVWVWNGRSSTTTETHVVTIVTDPPPITAPDRPDLHEVFAEHWPARFPLVDFGLGIACAKCTRDAKVTISDQMVPWPYAVVEKAITNGPAAEPTPIEPLHQRMASAPCP